MGIINTADAEEELEIVVSQQWVLSMLTRENWSLDNDGLWSGSFTFILVANIEERVATEVDILIASPKLTDRLQHSKREARAPPTSRQNPRESANAES